MPLVSAVAIAIAAAAVSVALYHVTVTAPRLRAVTGLLSGDAADAETLAALRAAVARDAALANARITALESLASERFLQAGFVRYNSFSDVGAELSYTLALLSGAGDGVVLTSIFSREETRTFGKAVTNFAPAQDASEEERRAIELVRRPAR